MAQSSVSTRALGRNGPQVPALGFGCMNLSAYYGKPAPDEERFKVLDRTLDLGATFWDTSDVCSSSLINSEAPFIIPKTETVQQTATARSF